MKYYSDGLNVIVLEVDGDVYAEFYEGNKFIPINTIKCDELLGELLEFGDTSFEISVEEKKMLRDRILSTFNFHLILKNIFKDYPFGISRLADYTKVVDYFHICEENNFIVNIDSFEKFLSCYELKHLPYVSITCEKYNPGDGLLFQKFFEKEPTPKEKFISLVNNTGNMKYAYLYEFCDYYHLLYILTYHLLKNKKILKKCKNCKKWFAPEKTDEKYCVRQIWSWEYIDGKKTLSFKECKLEANKKIRRERDRKNPLTKIENNKRTTLLNRTKATTISSLEKNERYQKYCDFVNEMQVKKEMRKNGSISFEEYEKWLNDYEI